MGNADDGDDDGPCKWMTCVMMFHANGGWWWLTMYVFKDDESNCFFFRLFSGFRFRLCFAVGRAENTEAGLTLRDHRSWAPIIIHATPFASSRIMLHAEMQELQHVHSYNPVKIFCSYVFCRPSNLHMQLDACIIIFCSSIKTHKGTQGHTPTPTRRGIGRTLKQILQQKGNRQNVNLEKPMKPPGGSANEKREKIRRCQTFRVCVSSASTSIMHRHQRAFHIAAWVMSIMSSTDINIIILFMLPEEQKCLMQHAAWRNVHAHKPRRASKHTHALSILHTPKNLDTPTEKHTDWLTNHLPASPASPSWAASCLMLHWQKYAGWCSILWPFTFSYTYKSIKDPGVFRKNARYFSNSSTKENRSWHGRICRGKRWGLRGF